MRLPGESPHQRAGFTDDAVHVGRRFEAKNYVAEVSGLAPTGVDLLPGPEQLASAVRAKAKAALITPKYA